MTARSSLAHEIVPLSDRLRYMRWFRLLILVAVGAFALLAPSVRTVPADQVAVVTGIYLGASLGGEGLWRLLRRRGLTLFSAMLIIDGIYLAWATYATGGGASPVRYLIVLHLIAVTLLASYRTGMKLALWHSLLLFVGYHAQESGLVPRTPGLGTREEILSQVTFMVAFWCVAIGTANWSAVNERELRRRKVDLEALARMAAALEEANGPVTVADVLLGGVTENFDFERGAVLGLTEHGLGLLARRGCLAAGPVPATPAEGSVLQVAVHQRTTLLVSDLDPEVDPWLCDALPEARNLAVVPLVADGAAIGVLVAEHGLRPGSRIERRVVSALERFTSHAALALRNAWLLDQINALAVTDGLTRILNRRGFNDTLEREMARATRDERSMALVMIDIDFFKALNDEHGHQVGDDVLAAFAQVLKSQCRTFDIPARYGGEEFALILPGCDARNATVVAERVRTAIESAPLPVHVTASLGISLFPAHGVDLDSMVKAADEALYASKRYGRNRVTVADTPVGIPRRAAGVDIC
jgi:two-component system, cell cycle response regulator